MFKYCTRCLWASFYLTDKNAMFSCLLFGHNFHGWTYAQTLSVWSLFYSVQTLSHFDICWLRHQRCDARNLLGTTESQGHASAARHAKNRANYSRPNCQSGSVLQAICRKWVGNHFSFVRVKPSQIDDAERSNWNYHFLSLYFIVGIVLYMRNAYMSDPQFTVF